MQDRQRIVFLDYARVAACFLVILCHAHYHIKYFHSVLGFETYGLDNPAIDIYELLARAAVPLFVMITSWLLLPIGESTDSFAFYRKHLTRVIPPFLFAVVLYAFTDILKDNTNVDHSFKMIRYIFVNYPVGHLWYVYVIVGIYLVIPIISPWLRQAGRRDELLFIALFALTPFLTLLHNTVGPVWGEAEWNPHHSLWYFSGFIGLLVIAHYIKTHLKWTAARRLFIGTAAALVTLTVMYFLFVNATDSGIFSKYDINRYSSPLVVLLSVSVFLAFTGMTALPESKLVSEISRHSYGIYLIHIDIMYVLCIFMGSIMPLPAWLSMPILSLVCLAMSYIIVKVLSYLPYARYIIGSSSRTPMKSAKLPVKG